MRHKRVHGARIFADVARGNGVLISRKFDDFGPQLNTSMSVGILVRYIFLVNCSSLSEINFVHSNN